MNATREPMGVTSPTLHFTIWFTIAVFVALITMSFIFKVEVVARGQGKVIPLSRVQVVQPEFDGKIIEIRVKNGDVVQQGSVLILLDETDARAEVNTISGELRRLGVERFRISVLLEGIGDYLLNSSILQDRFLARFSELEERDQSFFIEQQGLLRSEIEDLAASLEQVSAQSVANVNSVAVTQANINRVDAALDFQRERLEVAKDLLERGASNRSSYLDVQEAFTTLEAEKEIYLRELEQKVSQESALIAERQSIVTSFRNRLFQRRSEIDARSAVLNEQLFSAQRRANSSALLAPLNGVVDQLNVFTIGAVAKAGDELMRIVPVDQEVEIEATFSNADVGFIQVGQQANISFDAYPSARFGYLTGIVADLSADSVEAGENQWGYTSRVTPDVNYFEVESEQYLLRPGMTASIDVTTGSRRIISYFFAPIVETIQSALGER